MQNRSKLLKTHYSQCERFFVSNNSFFVKREDI
jgi:hypothetical protein